MLNASEPLSMSVHKDSHSSETFAAPERQHVLGVFRFFTRNMWILVRSFWPVLAGLAISEQIRLYGLSIGLFVVFGVTVSSIIEFWRFTFQVANEELIIKKGLIQQETLIIPLERIQSVSLSQAFWQRILGLSGLRIDTAGSGGAEVEFQALKSHDAIRLSQVLMGSSQGSMEADERKNEIIRLDWKRLFKVGLSQNHVRNAMLVFGAALAFFESLDTWLNDWVESLPRLMGFIVDHLWFLFIPMVSVMLLLLGFLVSVAGVILKYYQLNVKWEGSDLLISGGLFSRFSHRVPLQKIQMIDWRSTWLKRIFEFETVRIHQARAQQDGTNGAGVVDIPGLESNHSKALVGFLHPNWIGASTISFKAHGFWKRRLIGIRTILMVSLLYALDPSPWLYSIGVFLFLFVRQSAELSYQSFVVETDGDCILIKKGWLVRRRSLLNLHQLQRVSLSQNLLMKWRGMAHVTLHTAAGARKLHFLRQSDARKIYNWSLLTIETSQKPWM